jgi:hypothetical protein
LQNKVKSVAHPKFSYLHKTGGGYRVCVCVCVCVCVRACV